MPSLTYCHDDAHFDESNRSRIAVESQYCNSRLNVVRTRGRSKLCRMCEHGFSVATHVISRSRSGSVAASYRSKPGQTSIVYDYATVLFCFALFYGFRIRHGKISHKIGDKNAVYAALRRRKLITLHKQQRIIFWNKKWPNHGNLSANKVAGLLPTL